MKIVNPNVTLITEKSKTKKIELSGRTCYKSESKIHEGSDVKFAMNMIKSGHTAMIEFSEIIIRVDQNIFNEIKSSNCRFFNFTSYDYRYIISGNIRAWRNFIKDSDCSSVIREYFLMKLIQNEETTCLFSDINWNHDIDLNNVNFIFDILSEEDITKRERKYHKFYHFQIVADRGVMSEITRHRLASFAIESSRYVNYKGGIEFVKPYWYDDKGIKTFINRLVWKRYCKISESGYKWMIRFGMKPQQARALLPNSTRTIINISANLEEMNWIFKLRCAKSAHPDIRIITNQMKLIVTAEEAKI